MVGACDVVLRREKGIEIEKTEIDLRGAENLSDEFRARKFPFGRVPVLELDDGRNLAESVAICRYLEGLRPEPNLFGETTEEMAFIDMWIRRIDIDLAMAVAQAFPEYFSGIFGGRERCAKEWGEVSAEVARNTASLFNDHLEDNEYVTSDRYTIADMLLAITVGFAKQTGQDFTDMKHLARHFEAVGGRASSVNILESLPLPVIQAPMAGTSDSALAIAVCRAGGLGSLPCAMLSPEQIEREVDAIRTAVDAPFNLNFFCHEPVEPDEDSAGRWRHRLEPYYEEFRIQPEPSRGAGRQPFDETSANLVTKLEPPVVSFHFGLPAKPLLDQVKGCGAFVLSSATTVDEARWLADHGADAIIAQGTEAGGHRGHFMSTDLDLQTDTMTLLESIRSEVDLPIVAAGGISTREAVRAALEAGAIAIQAGTAYLMCPECNTSDVHRAVLRTAAVRETALTNVFSGRPARSIVNRIVREVGPLSDDAPPSSYAGAAIAPLRRLAEAEGSPDFSPLWCGTDASGCEAIPAGKMTQRLGTDQGLGEPLTPSRARSTPGPVAVRSRDHPSGRT
ncbi:MAG: nitronate monooxygenase [Gammaproteobacteria bacterium]|nr:nitronate monooxygenase [Gammaproteobacteria bacterium]